VTYAGFLAQKRPVVEASGIEVSDSEINPMLFPFQRDLVRWALHKGKPALFPDTGLGKTPMQLEWARLLGKKTLILAPLSVARQTLREATKFGVEGVKFAREQSDVSTPITVTNYEMMAHFDPSQFGAVVLDESSILKATEGVYRNKLIDAFAATPYRLCCTATPAPNDIQEITNHATFLSIMPRRDVLATFFIHAADDARSSGWRLKGHARPAFWRWLSSWAMLLKKPSDLGYSDEGYELPKLEILPWIVESDVVLSGRLFADRLHGIQDRTAVRHQTLDARVRGAVELTDANPSEPWIAWRGLIEEGRAMARLLGDRAILVEGPMSPEEKAEKLERFIDTENAVLITAPRIAGFGLNFQHCAKQVFVGLNDSYEQYYQCVRRSWRFGQTRPVTAYIVLSEIEQAIHENVLRKEREAAEMAQELIAHVASYEREELMGAAPNGYSYDAREEMALPTWL